MSVSKGSDRKPCVSSEHGTDVSGSSGKAPTVDRSTETENDARLKPLLFVDDELALLEARSLGFEMIGYPAFTASSGEEALEILQLHPVRAVVLDYLMPGMDGEETAKRIREQHADIPIFLSSGCCSVPKRLLDMVDGSVNKGTGPEALLAALEMLLQRVQETKPARRAGEQARGQSA